MQEILGPKRPPSERLQFDPANRLVVHVNRARIARLVLVLAVASAAGYYLEQGPRLLRARAASDAKQGEVLRLWSEPRLLPDIDFADGEGRPIRLSSFRGKVILLNIWATWCPPCRVEMPALDRLQANLGGPEFEVVALAIDDNGLAAVKLFNLHNGIRHLGIYSDKSGLAMSDLGVAAIPATLLIDRRGREIGRAIGPAEWDNAALARIVKEHIDRPAKP